MEQTGNLLVQKIISNFIENEFIDNKHLDFSKTPEYRSFINCCHSDKNNAYIQFGLFSYADIAKETDNISRSLGLGQTYRTYLKNLDKAYKLNFTLIIYQILILISNIGGPISDTSNLKLLKTSYIKVFDTYKDEDLNPILPSIFSFTRDIFFRLDEYAFKWELANGK